MGTDDEDDDDPCADVTILGGAEELKLETIREMIRHEDMLRDQRLGWLFALDGFLFATLGFMWDKPHTSLLIAVLALLGVAIGVSALGSMSISNRAVRNLRCTAQGRGRVMGIQDDKVFGDELPRWVHRSVPWMVMPWALIAIWPAIALIHAIQLR